MAVKTALLASTAGLLFAAGFAAQPPFTIEQVLDTPFPSNLSVSPAGETVAWVFSRRGASNVWVAEGRQFRTRSVTNWTADDGQTISQLAWTPDSSRILFVRGDGPNSKGEYPNPGHLALGTEQTIWIADLRGTVRQLTEGTAPTPAPDGSGFVFLRKGEIWWSSFEQDAKPKPLVKARGSARQMRWSPDGTRLALISHRGDHSFLGLYEIASASLRYPDPGLDVDSDPVWSPDGRRVAFLRTPSGKERLWEPKREGIPWSIRVVDLTTGHSREVWRADAGAGSVFRGTTATNQLIWSRDDYLVFPWERDGWTHLYSVAGGGGTATLLTPGRFEVEDVVPGPAGNEVFFNSNAGDTERRHLWKVSCSGGAPTAITGGTGIEWSPAPLKQPGTIAFLRSTSREPAQPWIVEDSTQRPLAPESLPARFPRDHLVEPQPVSFSSADGMTLPGQLFLPANSGPDKKHPAVVFFHGGSRRQMLLGWHYLRYYHNCYAFNQYLSSLGFIVLSVNYRSGTGYGMEFREALDYGPSGASEFNDVLGAGLFLRARSDVDPAKIALWGGSYGGYLTALGLARASDLFAAGVDLHGVHDWRIEIRDYRPDFKISENPEASQLAFQSSPMAFVETWRSPVLLVHGDDDRNVPFEESIILAEALRKRGVAIEELVFPDEVHGFLKFDSWLRSFEAASAFLLKHLNIGD